MKNNEAADLTDLISRYGDDQKCRNYLEHFRLRNWMARLRWMKPMSAERKSDGVSTLAQKPRKLSSESGNAAAICVSSMRKMPRAAHWRNTSRRMSAATWM